MDLITREIFGLLPNGENVYIYKLKNRNGISAEITNYGCVIVRLFIPDRNGNYNDVVLGFNTLEEYIRNNSPYFGAVVGRYANRIAEGRFTLNGTEVRLALNNAPGNIPCSLHGGNEGFSAKLWKSEIIYNNNAPSLSLSYTSANGEEGYPGKLDVNVTYSISDDNELKIQYRAVSDKSTHINLTNHSYFNLKGEGNGHIDNHIMKINAEKFTPVNIGMIPTGQIEDVKNTPLDFTREYPIGARLDEDNEQLKLAGGYDHNWVLDKEDFELSHALSVYEPGSGRFMEVYTTEPGVHLYSGNFLDGSLTGKSGKAYDCRCALAIETQHFPDSPNQPDFPSTILNPGEIFNSRTIYKFSTK